MVSDYPDIRFKGLFPATVGPWPIALTEIVTMSIDLPVLVVS